MSDRVCPIRPEEVVSEKEKLIPDVVISSFNNLIAEKWNGVSAEIKQPEIVKLLVAAGLDKDEIFKRHWLDVEDIFRAVGWVVEYDKPGYNESYDAFFVFRKNKNK